MAISSLATKSKTADNRDCYTSPGFCRIDAEGIHVLNRYKGEHLISWNEVRGVEEPRGNCRHDYLKVVTKARDFANPVPVADREHADLALAAIHRYRPGIG